MIGHETIFHYALANALVAMALVALTLLGAACAQGWYENRVARARAREQVNRF